MHWIKNNWLSVLASALLVGALFSIEFFVYYQLMNWVVVGASIMVAFRAKRDGKEWLMWLFALVAVVFNPLAPLYLRADVWQIADVVASLMFVVTFFLFKVSEGK
jgi:Na+/alanine symporter